MLEVGSRFERTMNSEIEGYLYQLLSIKQDYPGIVARLSHEQFNWRPAPDKWSIAQCFDHLNLTAAKFVPAMDAAITRARQQGSLSQGPFAYPMLERWFVRSQEPPPRMRTRAFKRFIPASERPASEVMPRFANWQEQIGEQIRNADGIDLARARHKSPVLPILTWRLGTMIALTLAHERRHIWQARQVRTHPNFPA
jgi:hypothetical protein